MKRHVAPHPRARIRQGGVRGAVGQVGRVVLAAQMAQQQVPGAAFRQMDGGLRAALIAQMALFAQNARFEPLGIMRVLPEQVGSWLLSSSTRSAPVTASRTSWEK